MFAQRVFEKVLVPALVTHVGLHIGLHDSVDIHEMFLDVDDKSELFATDVTESRPGNHLCLAVLLPQVTSQVHPSSASEVAMAALQVCRMLLTLMVRQRLN